ncbi:MAG: class I SAM-dependent methyltransferase [Rhizobiaceae bacterium]
MPSLSYVDPRLAAVYDALNPALDDYDFHASLAGGSPVSVLDVGSGTGRLSLRLAAMGHRVVGAEPAAGMLAVARAKPAADRVRWVGAAAADIDLADRFDLIVITGHVFQVFLTDEEIVSVLRNLRRHLAPGGRISFESRNVAAREWETWTASGTTETIAVDGVGPVECCFEVTDVSLPLVTYETRFRFPDGRHHAAPDTLRFHTPVGLEALVVRAGLAVAERYGSFDRSPLMPDSPEIALVAVSA